MLATPYCSANPASVLATVTVALLCLSAAGCGNSEHWHTETNPIQGSIRINGQIPQGALVTLYPTGDAVDVRESKPWGIVDETGVYQLRTYAKGDGAPEGEFRATVVWREDPSVQGSPDQLGGAFEDPTQSQWTFTIDPEQQELPPIEITDAKLSKPKSNRRTSVPSPFEDPAEGN